MNEILHSTPAIGLHDLLRLVNVLLAVAVLAHMVGVALASWSARLPSARAEMGATLALLLAIIIGSVEAVRLDTPPTIRTPIITLALVLFIVGRCLKAKERAQQ